MPGIPTKKEAGIDVLPVWLWLGVRQGVVVLSRGNKYILSLTTVFNVTRCELRIISLPFRINGGLSIFCMCSAVCDCFSLV